MADDKIVVAPAAAIIAVVAARRLQRKRKRSCCVRPCLLHRPQLGIHGALFRDLRQKVDITYKNFCRMDAAAYQELLALVARVITKKDTPYRQAISADERLCVTLRFLATG